MKRVFTNSTDVIHLWAQRTQSEARCSNVFFEPDYKLIDGEWTDLGTSSKIYSYGKHYLLAEFLDDSTVWINDNGYSVTTAKHIREVTWATSQYKHFFKSSTDIDTVYYTIQENLKSLGTARKPEKYINPIFHLWEKLNEYLEYTRTKTKAKKNKKYREIAKIVEKLNNGSEDFRERLKVQAEKDRAKRVKAEKKSLKEALEKFNNYETNWFKHGSYDFLRISQDGERVETSQNVKVPIEDARLLYRAIKAGKDVKGYRISHYTVTSINGTLKIGCHNINMDSVHEVGKAISIQ